MSRCFSRRQGRLQDEFQRHRRRLHVRRGAGQRLGTGKLDLVETLIQGDLSAELRPPERLKSARQWRRTFGNPIALSFRPPLSNRSSRGRLQRRRAPRHRRLLGPRCPPGQSLAQHRRFDFDPQPGGWPGSPSATPMFFSNLPPRRAHADRRIGGQRRDVCPRAAWCRFLAQVKGSNLATVKTTSGSLRFLWGSEVISRRI